MRRTNWIATATAALLAIAMLPACAGNHEGADAVVDAATAAAPATPEAPEVPDVSGACEKACYAALDTCTQKCQDVGNLELCPAECMDKQESCKKACGE